MSTLTVTSCENEKLPVAAVIAIIFVVSWIGTIPQVMASWVGANAVPGYVKLLQFFILAPGVVALWAAWMNGGWAGFRQLLGRLVRWRAAWWIYAAVLLGTPAVIVASVLISNALGFTALTLPAPAQALAAFAPTFLVYLLLNTEELAWRGYVLPRMQSCWSPLVAALVLGAIWTLFHAPYFFMKGGHPGGFTPLLFVLSLLPFSVLLTRTFNATAGSVLLPHLLHQSINSWGESLPFLPRFAHSLAPVTISVTILIVLSALLVVTRPPMWLKLSMQQGAN
jgi:membrane protease YdiL (CAAX protease family)